MADDEIANELPTDQDADETLIGSEPEGGESSEVRAGDDALVDEGVIENKPSSDDPPETECPPCKGGAPAWMATFADMATLLMAFFVLLLSFAETEVPKFKQVAGSLKQAFGIEKIVPKVTIPMARSVMVENFTPAVAERSVIDQKEQLSDFVRGDFIEKKTEEGEFDKTLQKEFQQVQEALEAEINAGMADVKVENGEIKVTLVENSSGAGAEGSEGKGKGGLVAQATIDAVAKIADVSNKITSTVGVHVADKSDGAAQGARSTASNSVRDGGSGLSKYDQLRADLQDEIARGLAEVEKEGDKIIVRLASQGGFVSGSAGVRDSFSPTLIKLGNTLSKYPGMVKVEGHTDNVPVAFSEKFKSNWDLSAARAAAIADYLLTSSTLEAGSLQIAGFADTRPLDTNETPNGRSRNRRIEVIVDDA